MTEIDDINLVNQFVEIRNKFIKNNNDEKLKKEYEMYHSLCISRFEYIVTYRSNKYKSFPNYKDLHQDGIIALMSALRTYKPKKGNIFAWVHKYVGTKIKREANKHSVVKIPFKKAREMAFKKTNISPMQLDMTPSVFDQFEELELKHEIISTIQKLSPIDKKIIMLTYGFGGIKPYSITKLSKAIGLPKAETMKLRNKAIDNFKTIFNGE